MHSLKKIFLFFFILCGALCLKGQHQVISSSDTVGTLHSTMFTDSLKADSLQTNSQKTKSSIQTPIKYEAEKIYNSIDNKQTILSGKAKITYQDITLKAAEITVEWEKNLMHAEGRKDSVWMKNEETGDSTKTEQWVGLPEFSEAGDEMKGEKMDFNFKTKKGRVIIVGIYSQPVDVNLFNCLSREVSIIPSWCYSYIGLKRTYELSLELVSSATKL